MKCCKVLKTGVRMMVLAAMAGGVIYYLKKTDACGQENGEKLAEKFGEKAKKVKAACGCVREETKDMASEVKFAAQYTAEEMRDGFHEAKEAVKQAADTVKGDMKEIRDSVETVFEDGETS